MKIAKRSNYVKQLFDVRGTMPRARSLLPDHQQTTYDDESDFAVEDGFEAVWTGYAEAVGEESAGDVSKKIVEIEERGRYIRREET